MFSSRISEWMTTEPITIGPKGTLPEALKLMKEKKIRRLPVVDRGRLVGIVTWGDVREASPSDANSLSVWELNYLLSKLTVDEIMTRPVLTVTPDQTLYDAARMMYREKVSGLPVVEEGKVVGILTESDIFRMIVQQWETSEVAGAAHGERVPA